MANKGFCRNNFGVISNVFHFESCLPYKINGFMCHIYKIRFAYSHSLYQFNWQYSVQTSTEMHSLGADAREYGM